MRKLPEKSLLIDSLLDRQLDPSLLNQVIGVNETLFDTFSLMHSSFLYDSPLKGADKIIEEHNKTIARQEITIGDLFQYIQTLKKEAETNKNDIKSLQNKVLEERFYSRLSNSKFCSTDKNEKIEYYI